MVDRKKDANPIAKDTADTPDTAGAGGRRLGASDRRGTDFFDQVETMRSRRRSDDGGPQADRPTVAEPSTQATSSGAWAWKTEHSLALFSMALIGAPGSMLVSRLGGAMAGSALPWLMPVGGSLLFATLLLFSGAPRKTR